MHTLPECYTGATADLLNDPKSVTLNTNTISQSIAIMQAAVARPFPQANSTATPYVDSGLRADMTEDTS